MPAFGTNSEKALASCHSDLQRLAYTAIMFVDFSVLEGHRNEADQNKAYAKGFSKVRWPNGKHNKLPSNAFDFAPYPIDWSDKEVARQRFVYVAGILMGIAFQLGIQIRWGGDWDRDFDTRDEKFRDLGHIELV